MILAFDTYYFGNKAKTVCLKFDDAEKYLQVYTEVLEDVAEYIPGEFYKRELPCIMSLINKMDVTNISCIIVDGFVFLDDNNKPGLGGYLYEALDRSIPVVGVAKTNFATIEKNKRLLFRGGSNNPLFITAVGIELDKAVNKIGSLKGNFRIPTLLKLLDRYTKQV
ncbi:MAG TPA: endonuclease V [Flavobacterium sp.]|jgi:exodeoxyribonuclease-5/deoxyribonuclease V